MVFDQMALVNSTMLTILPKSALYVKTVEEVIPADQVTGSHALFVNGWLSNSTRLAEYEAKRTRYLCFRTAQIVLCSIGLVGNAAAILAWTASRRRTPIVVLMASLALWDLGLLTSVLYYCVRNLTWWHSRANTHQYPWSGSLYKMGYDPAMYFAILAFHSFVCTSVFTVLAISFVRYIAVVRPLVARRICSRKRMKYIIGGIITMSLLLSFCFCLEFMCLSFQRLSYFCEFVSDHKRAFSYPDYIIIGILPWFGTIPLSILLIIHVSRIPRERSVRRGSNPASMEYGPKRLTLYVIVMMVLSTVTYPVSQNMFLAIDESPNWKQSTKENLYLVGDFLLIINSIAHVILFCAGGTYFRSLMYARLSYICTCFCQITSVVCRMKHRQEEDIGHVRFNMGSSRDRVATEQSWSLYGSNQLRFGSSQL